jgi:hypothetical protein
MGLLLEQADRRAGASCASPRTSVSMPAMMRRTVDLPAPL